MTWSLVFQIITLAWGVAFPLAFVLFMIRKD